MPASELPAAAAPAAHAAAVDMSESPAPRATRGHGSRVWARLRVRFWLKAIGTTAFMWLFFAGYFHVLRHPTHAAAVMPLTSVDRWIGFAPWALWPYVSLWVYVALPP